MECFSSDFLVEMSKFAFRVADWLLSIKCKHFGAFLEIFYFPNILSHSEFFGEEKL